MSSSWTVGTGRLVLAPVGWADLPALVALKGDPLVYAQMLGGVRGPALVARELAEDITFWARHGAGMWMVRPFGGGVPVGLTGLHERSDGRGIALRFAFTPASRGKGMAREAAAAALRYGHDQAGMDRVVAVARESNFGSRTVLGAVGMVECETFLRGQETMLVFESLRRRLPVSRSAAAFP